MENFLIKWGAANNQQRQSSHSPHLMLEVPQQSPTIANLHHFSSVQSTNLCIPLLSCLSLSQQIQRISFSMLCISFKHITHTHRPLLFQQIHGHFCSGRSFKLLQRPSLYFVISFLKAHCHQDVHQNDNSQEQGNCYPSCLVDHLSLCPWAPHPSVISPCYFWELCIELRCLRACYFCGRRSTDELMQGTAEGGSLVKRRQSCFG